LKCVVNLDYWISESCITYFSRPQFTDIGNCTMAY
jgi:hypothetical protein